MQNVKVLDCTLRDGGYCNQWNFGSGNIRKIVSGLVEAQIDIIECGFLTNKVVYDENITKFTAIDEVATVIPKDREGKLYVCMVNYGEYDISQLPNYDGTSVDGLRVAFHKKDMLSAMESCKEIKAKGYKVFVQAMVSLNYSDNEFLELIHLANKVQPYSFYIVDSFGVMKRKDLIRLFYMVEHNLEESISIGYHSHNNMQLAYSNAQALVDIRSKRNLIIDSSVYGMGRGAGNLNTELFVEYLNDNVGTTYKLKPLLVIIDEILNDFYQRNYWGYSLPNYLSASYNAHPNYAGYLDNKKTLTVESMEEIFSMMEPEKKSVFDKEYIEKLYEDYMATGSVQEMHFAELKEKIFDKKVLIIAPGKSSVDEKEKILEFAQQEGVVSISVNFDYQGIETDYIFLSNLRRFKALAEDKRGKSIVTSNIPASGIYLQTKYKDLTNNVEMVRDNAGMMLIKFLIALGVKEVYFAGLDGYSVDPMQNFAEDKMNFVTERAVFEAMNEGMKQVLTMYAKQIKIEFITSPKHVEVNYNKNKE